MTRKFPMVARGFIAACEKVEHGTLRLVAPDGTLMTFGEGAPEAELKINDWAAISAIVSRGEIGAGEAYTDGAWDSPDIEALAYVASVNDKAFGRLYDGSFFHRISSLFVDRFMRRNSRSGSKANIHAHYDVGNDFYKLWLDPSMTYSSALYQPGDDLLTAQNNKYDRILSATGDDGDRTLEIGCGWGGFAERAAEQGRDVTGISVSQEQVAFANSRLDGRANVRFQDYRDVTGKFDSIVSIEMIEAVGESYWPTYFKTLKDRLADTGNALIQAIIVEDETFASYRMRSDYIRHYIFPGGMLLSPKSISTQAQQAGLQVDEMFRFGNDYARTLREWLDRFSAAEGKIRALGYSEAFVRSWKFYLQICAASFAVEQTDVVQVRLRHA